MKKSKILVVAIIILALAAATGCGKEGGVKGKTEVLIKPSTLFEGDLKALEPHLEISGGCVEVEYSGDKKSMKCSYEIWKEGKLEESGGGTWIPVEKGFKANVSTSLQGMYLDNMETSPYMIRTIAVGDDSGYSSSKGYIERFDSSYAWGDVKLNEDLEGPDDREYAVWGLTAGDEMRTGGIEESVKGSSWGYMLKISFED
ncbi:hypothetical protein SAMN02745945_02235 [Peptoclostridium litorale DSM 5388]|uniref:Putative lipoprotein n=1 Tax=Peptoclostridium litorale DSM 5388 TaxID=1121324 RepID=A0A069RHW6_PEPLI|nr:hypothetical protein [Peptoclostridium litorale]KDR95750.1 putative lipoprotein [Peptoclostridium litorale DSM 5388]SIO22070.1 hypothetical protein SAMN02745945_02235 [Peptoclostridium litorale DSM 5388]